MFYRQCISLMPAQYSIVAVTLAAILPKFASMQQVNNKLLLVFKSSVVFLYK